MTTKSDNKTSIMCSDKRHTIVHLQKTGLLSLHHCDSAEVLAKADRIVALAKLGRATEIANARGCLAFAILVAGIPMIRFDGHADPITGATVDAGPFRPLYNLYSTNGLFRKLVERARKKHAVERRALDKPLEICVGRQLRRYFTVMEAKNAPVSFAYDVSIEQLARGWVVASYDGEAWTVPYMPGWHEKLYKNNLGVLNGHFVCGQDPDDKDLFYVIEQREGGGFHVKGRLASNLLKAA